MNVLTSLLVILSWVEFIFRLVLEGVAFALIVEALREVAVLAKIDKAARNHTHAQPIRLDSLSPTQETRS